MAQLPINRNKRQTHITIATASAAATVIASSIAGATAANSISNNQMLNHKLKHMNNQNHQINERVIIKTTIPTTPTTIEATTSSCKCLNNNDNKNNNKNKYNKNLLRKVKSMPNLMKQLNITNIINYDDHDNHHRGDTDNDNDVGNDKNFINYYDYKQKMSTLTTITKTKTTATTTTTAITTSTTATRTATSTPTTTSKMSTVPLTTVPLTTVPLTTVNLEKNVKEMLMETEMSSKEKRDCCVHYKRNVMLVTPCCNKTYKCRFCHDENETHRLECKSVTELICTQCQTRQKVQECCQNCGIQFGKYTCLICNLFDDLDKQQYHCDKCGICRVGGRENFFHCTVCNICLPKHLLINGHRCIENISRSHCPICLVKIHTSRLPCYIPPCGHLLHNVCFEQLLQNGFYKCPICQMSLLDMTVLWEFLDLQQQLMPATATTTIMPIKCDKKTFQIFCNDCLNISRTKFHVIGLKCLQCGSYNTTANNNKNDNNNNNTNDNNNNNSNNIDNINNLNSNNKEFTLLTGKTIRYYAKNSTTINVFAFVQDEIHSA